MTPQERELLTQLTQRINQTQLQEKDPDAENLLGRELGANPDAIYILAQTVLVQDIALQQAKTQLAQLQQQLKQANQQPAHATSFLGRLLGEHEPQQPPPPQQQTQQPPFQPVQYAPQAPPPYAPPQYAPPMYTAPSGQPSFLRSAAQTAAGVAAGALAFEGIESLLHGGFGHGGWGPGAGLAGFGMGPGLGMSGAYERPIEETVVNNYYDQPGPMGSGEHRFDAGGEHHAQDFSGQSGAQFSNAGSDASQNEDLGSFDQGTFDPEMDNASVADDNSLNDVQIDDSGSFDDGGGFDNGGDKGF